MQRATIGWWLTATLATAFSAAQAQHQPAPMAGPDPLDPRADVPPAVYRSTLTGHRAIGDDKPVPWREANDNVGRIGGWRAYAREAAAAPAAPTPEAAPPAAPAPAGHDAHKH